MLLFFIGSLLPISAGALDQLLSISGGSMPDVPMPGNPQPVDQQTYQEPSYNYSRPQPSYEELQRRKKQREERRKARERARKNARREAEYRKDREKRIQAEKAWPKGLPRKRTYTQYNPKRKNSLIAVPEKVNPGEEAKALQEVTLKIKGLRLKSKLSYDEKQALQKLENKARELWFKAIKHPDGGQDRYRLVMPLAVQNFSAYKEPSVLNTNTLQVLRNYKDKDGKSAAVIDPIARFYQEKTGQLIELKAEELVEKLSDSNNSFAEVLAVGKISLQLADKNYHAAAGETVNYLIGKIPYPQAQLAAEGGKIYANVSFRALNNFMNKAMAATGASFDQKKFWDELKAEMSFSQKTFLKWAGDPEND